MPKKTDGLGAYKSKLKENKINKEITLKKLEQSKKVVQVAVTSNLIIFTSKCYGFVTSQSAAMFAESMHSLADVFNQGLLMFGLIRSLRAPDYTHPYGYETSKYSFAMLSGFGVFFLGGGVTLYHGISGLLDPTTLLDIRPALVALGSCLIFDLGSMTFAFRNIRQQATEVGMEFFPYLLKSADPSSVQVFLEDLASVTGVCIASASLILAKYFGMPIFDAIGSISIGVLLSGLGVFLIRRNMQSLAGPSMAPEHELQIIKLIEEEPTVKSVHHVKTTSIGPDWARFKAEILFDGEEIAQRYFNTNPHKHSQNIEILKTLKTNGEIEEWMRNNSNDVLSVVGKEIDRLELKIQAVRPEVKHIDLEIL